MGLFIFSTASRQRAWAPSSGKLYPHCSLQKNRSHGLSHKDRLAGLILLSEIVNHISVTRKNSQNASPAKLAAIISHRADVTAKTSPTAGATLSTWARRLRSWRQLPGAPGSPPEEKQAGDPIILSWGHKPPLCNFIL